MDVSSWPVFLSKKRKIGSRCQLRAERPQKKKKDLTGSIFKKNTGGRMKTVFVRGQTQGSEKPKLRK